MTNILLAGASASGKSTLARSLCASDARHMVSSSTYLRHVAGPIADNLLAEFGRNLDGTDPGWMHRLVQHDPRDTPCVVDAIRSEVQSNQFRDVIRVNVIAADTDRFSRAATRGRSATADAGWTFPNADFTWDSSRVSLSTATALINQLSGKGCVDVLIGGQYGSEGKGKLAALLAPNYQWLVRSGGPNAGHWVRDDDYEFCFHHIPSGSMANRDAGIMIAAGATLGPGFLEEVRQSGVAGRLFVDPNAVIITEADRHSESVMVDLIGSTAQGVGAATARRVTRNNLLATASDDELVRQFTHAGPCSARIAKALAQGCNVMLEGTQGSALSLYHGPYPYTTSRDTNVGGLLAEVGVPPSAVRDIWMVCRTFPIRTGGNSGPMRGELTYDALAALSGQDVSLLKSRELTSTTKRQRRVGIFDWDQFNRACEVNRPSKLFLSFADYLDPMAVGVTRWSELPGPVVKHVERMERESGTLVAGVSTGRHQRDVAWRS